MEFGQSVFYKPLSSISDDAPIEFVVLGNGSDYIDLSQTMVYLTAKIVKADDTAGKMDNVADENDGLVNRRVYTAKSREAEMIGHIHAHLFNGEKFLINGVEMRVKFVCSRDSFNVMAAAGSTYKVKILEASLIVRRMKRNPTILLAHTKALESSSAKYLITRADVKVLTIPSGVQRKSLDNVFLGQLPKRCIIGFVSNTAFNGEYKTNTFKTITAYFYDGNNISRSEYSHGYCLWAFDLTPDLSANASTPWNLVKNGSLRIEVGFGEALTETVNCLVYAEFDNIIEIDKDRKVVVDFSEEKKNVLSFLDKTILNLEDLKCPPLDKLKEKLVVVQCLNHNIASPVCAIENVMYRVVQDNEHLRNSTSSENNASTDEFIANTDPSFRPGQHWNAFFIDENGYGEYFDSFGRPPEGNHMKFLEQNSVTWCYNSQILQSFTSDFCGIYCLVYLYFKPHSVSSLEFLNMFNDDLASNDCVVKLLYDFVFEKIIT
ncbi:hypothetical protein ILUMI_14763 [Ignelater luminosus]|uniref:Uncharacterized protein n=1 Tax=Ignelater luminosus TaxID=2038154 RepID=A0A8K0CPX8_IGNLU|nr:hypothetical protein ILUMI_14763 [Ignelater luminosus]